MIIVIGLVGKMYAGKSEAAKAFQALSLESFGGLGRIVPFAGPLKAIAKQMGWNGVKDQKGRRLLQLLGTECMRECIDVDGWIKLWHREVESPALSKLVICDDCRFDNEARAVKSYPNGWVIEVLTTDALRAVRAAANNEQLAAGGHASEAGIDRSLIDMTIDNTGSQDDLRQQARTHWAAILKKARNPCQ